MVHEVPPGHLRSWQGVTMEAPVGGSAQVGRARLLRRRQAREEERPAEYEEEGRRPGQAKAE
eukprot:7801870-Alexandrium_andersonii.AAC.1